MILPVNFNSKKVALNLILCSFILQTAFVMATPVSQQTLPIRRVIIYKHGVGYIERRGPVEDQAEVMLRFKPQDMSDILKSLTVLDLGGGNVHAITYDSTRTVDQQLDEYTFDLRNADGLPAVLRQLKGSDVTINVEGRSITGRLLAVESRLEYSGTDRPAEQYYLSLLTPAAAAREYNFRDITDIKFTDPALQRDLEKYLGTLFSRHRRDEKRVLIKTDGQGRRELFAAYIQEQPVWKATYRLVLSDNQPPLLQAWAIVDNVGVEDWENVELALVSGLPVSFRQNLYDPFFVQRREIELQAATAVGPAIHAPGAPPARAMMQKARSRGEMAVGAADAVMEAPREMMAMSAPDLAANMARQAVTATAQEAGALFIYNIDTPVTIRRDQSALLPIVNSPVTADRLSIYNANIRADNPMDAIRLRNTTGLTLEGGPVTVLSDNTYAGEALIETLKDDEERYISFAVDLGTRVSIRHGSTSQSVYSVRIMHGSMITYYRQRQTRDYTAHNLEDRAKTLVIEHPRRPNWQLKDTPDPRETTDEHYRFEMPLPARAHEVFTVTEESPGHTTYSLSNITSEQISLFLRQKYIDRTVQNFIEQMAAIQAEINARREKIRILTADREAIFKNQTRLRENLQALGTSESEREYRSRIVKQLNQEEDRLAEIDREIKEHETTMQKQQEELNRRMMEFSFETKL